MKVLRILVCLLIVTTAVLAACGVCRAQTGEIRMGRATVDGMIGPGEWAGANWIVMDETYYASPAGGPYDLDNAAWAALWDSSENRIYVAITGTDTDHVMHAHSAWNGQDAIELYIDPGNSNINPYSGFGAISGAYYYAQQYVVGYDTNTSSTWAWLGDPSTAIPTGALPAYVFGLDGNQLTYEFKLRPFNTLPLTNVPAATEVMLAPGVVMGLDVVMNSRRVNGDFGMLCENTDGSKFINAGRMHDYVLAGPDLPFTEDFEFDYADGSAITAYHHWMGDSSAVVTAAAAMAGSLGGHVPAGSAVSNLFFSGSSGRMWTDLEMVALLLDETNRAPAVSTAAALFYLNTNGHPVVRSGSGAWTTVLTTPTAVPVTPYLTGAVLRVTLFERYASKTWALFLDEVLVAQEVGFVDESVDSYRMFGVRGGNTAFDNLTITNGYPAGFTHDGDGDGLHDAWEIHYFDSLALTATADPDRDGKDNGKEHDRGTDPTDPLSVPPSHGVVLTFR